MGRKGRIKSFIFRFIVLFSLCTGILILADLYLPTVEYVVAIEKKDIVIKETEGKDTTEYYIIVGNFKESIKKDVFDSIKIGEKIQIYTTPVFQEISLINSLDTPMKRFTNVSTDKGSMKFIGFLLIFNSSFLIYSLKYGWPKDIGIRGIGYLCISVIFGIISIGLWVNIIRVHILGVDLLHL